MPQLIVFDFGGTLDTHGRHWSHLLYEGWKRQLPKVSWNVFWEAYVQAERTLHTEPDWDFLRTLQEKCLLEAQYMGDNVSRKAALGVAQWCHREAELCISLSRYLLERLRRQTPLVLVSNFYGNLSAVLSAFGLSDCFEHVIESARVGIRKPDPAIYAKVLELYPSIPPGDILVVGDSEKNDMLPAVSLGMNALLVRNFDDLLALI